MSSTASVTVQNAFDLTEIAPLSFGVVTAQAASDDGKTGGGFTVHSDGTAQTAIPAGVDASDATKVGAKVTKITDGTPAEFSITNTAPFSVMTITLPTDAIDIKNPSATDSEGHFVMSEFNAFNMVSGRSISVPGGVGKITTDETGAANFKVGAQLLAATGAGTFIDGEYRASYDVKVKY